MPKVPTQYMYLFINIIYSINGKNNIVLQRNCVSLIYLFIIYSLFIVINSLTHHHHTTAGQISNMKIVYGSVRPIEFMQIESRRFKFKAANDSNWYNYNEQRGRCSESVKRRL